MRRYLLVTLISGLLLEALLQIGAVAVWLAHSRDDSAQIGNIGGEGTTILCIGDSYTHGIGASDKAHAYPAQLERALHDKHGLGVTVVNRGWPSSNSREVVGRLKANLEEVRPDFVCILVGVNDLWSKPEPLHPDYAKADENTIAPADVEAVGAFRWRWRTARLFLWATGNKDTEDEPKPVEEPRVPPPVVAPQTKIATPEVGEPLPTDSMKLAWFHVRRNEWEQARAAFEAVIARWPNSPGGRAGLVKTLVHLFQPEAAREVVAQIEELLAERNDLATAEALLQAHSDLGDHEATVATAKRLAATFPDSKWVWNAMATSQLAVGDTLEAEQAFERTLKLIGTEDKTWRASLLRQCGRAAAPRDSTRALQLIFAGLLLDRDHNATVLALRMTHEHLPPDMIEAFVADLDLTDEQQQDVLRVVGHKLDKMRLDQLKILLYHLVMAAKLCENTGAQPIVLTYPQIKNDKLRLTHLEAAKHPGLVLAPVQARFVKELEHREPSELFIWDGHCNDAGYAIVADVVADVIAPLVK